MDLGRNDDGVRGRDEGIFRNRSADLAHGDLGRERAAMVHDGLSVAIVDVHCRAVSLSVQGGLEE